MPGRVACPLLTPTTQPIGPDAAGPDAAQAPGGMGGKAGRRLSING